MNLLEAAESILYTIVEAGILLMETMGIVVLLYTGARCFIRWVQKLPHVRLDLAKGIALALGFKMGGEVLRTVIVQNWIELGILGVVVLLRILMTLLIHWEIRNEEESMGKFAEEKPPKEEKKTVSAANSGDSGDLFDLL